MRTEKRRCSTLFIPEYEAALAEHLTRVQMLDFVV
jgi:hypothetical protein